jgi:6-phosphogluconolactonase
VAIRAAELIAAEAWAAAKSRGRFSLAVSGGRTPWQMLRELARLTVPWSKVHVFQVDERVAPAGDPDRNLTHIREKLVAGGALPPAQLHAMPVEGPDLPAAARRYTGEIEAVAGQPPVFDLIHLGLGPDGHTASLVPADPVLQVRSVDVALSGLYQGRTRMTLTYPILDRARRIVWVVTGVEKASAIARLHSADRTIPAGRVRQDRAILLADRAAAGPLATN